MNEMLQNKDLISALASVRTTKPARLTGWRELDALGIGFSPKELSFVSARTGHGKTTAMLNLLLNWLVQEDGQTFIFYSYELPVDAVAVKLISAMTRLESGVSISYYAARSWLSGEKCGDSTVNDALQLAVQKMRSWNDRVLLVYQPSWNVAELSEHARAQLNALGEVGAVLVDYLQLVPPPPSSYDRRDLEVATVARQLKKLSVELDCPIVTAAQMGRLSPDASQIPHGRPFDAIPVQEAIRTRRPRLQDLAYGASEQEADLILGLLNYRADFMAEREDAAIDDRAAAGPLDVCVLKNRFGSLGISSLILEGESGLIRDLTFREGNGSSEG